MQKTTFRLPPDQPFIELILLLKATGNASTGGHAKMMVGEGGIHVNGEVELRKRKKLVVGDVVEFDGIQIEITDKD